MAKKVTTEDNLKQWGLVKDANGNWYRPKANVIQKKQPLVQKINDSIEVTIGRQLLITFNINPIGKPRMTQRDKWLNPPRKNVGIYWKYKAEIIAESRKYNFTLPESNYHIIAYIQMPHSWTSKKKGLMSNTPHQQKPDKDNIEKGILDALLTDDSKVWDGRVTKYWGEYGKILIYNIS